METKKNDSLNKFYDRLIDLRLPRQLNEYLSHAFENMEKKTFCFGGKKGGKTSGIKNKPDSLPANGGNADTVGGFSIEHLMNHQVVDYIIGYDDKCDIRINEDQSNVSVINQILANNSIAFKKGVY